MLCVIGIGCGGAGVPALHGTSWDVPVLAGIAVDPKHPQGWIHVDRSSGTVSYSYQGKVYPTLTRKELWRREYDFVHR